MAGNKAIAYIEPGKVEVQTIDYPKLEVQDGPGVHPDNVGRKTPHGVILKIVATNICGSDQHMVRGRTTAPAGPDPGPRDHRRGDRGRPRRRVHQEGRPGLGAVQHRLRPLPHVQGGQHGRLPERQPRRLRLGLRLRRHGRLGRRPGRVRDGALRRLEPAQVPRQGAGAREDPGPDDALGHLPDRLSRLRVGGRDERIDRLHRGRGPGRPRGRARRPAARRGAW